MRVLHVEDNPVDADLVARTLSTASTQITLEHVYTLAEARDLLNHVQRFDLALVDLKLPDGSGLDLLGEIRERELPLAVVMLTGSGDQRSAIAALQSGADDYMPKDIESFSRLPATLRSAHQRFTDNVHRRSRTLRVLYAEHSASDIDLTRRHLERYNPYIRLTVVPDTTLALSHLPPDRNSPSDFDVVLLDYRLPGLDALEAVKTIRGERRLETPIIIVSGQGSEQIAAKAIQLGVDDYIAKHPGYLFELAPTLEKVHRQAELQREQRTLHQTSQHLESMLDTSPVMLYSLALEDGEAKAIWVSSNIGRLLGYSPQEALANDWWISNLHAEDRDAAVTGMNTLFAQGRVQQDYRFIGKDGQVHWIRDELRLQPATDGPAREAHGAWQDITDRKQSEQIQQARTTTLNGLVTGQPLGDILHQVAIQLEYVRPEVRVCILLCDPRCGELYTAAAPSLPDEFNDAIDGLKAKEGQGSCGTAAARGETVIVENVRGHPYWAGFEDLALQAGIQSCWSVPFRDQSGGVLGTVGVYLDRVSSPAEGDLHLIEEFAAICGLAVQRANADANLRQAAAVFDSTREGVVITDLEPRIIAVNRAYTEITGYTEPEALGRNPSYLQSGRQDESFFQSLWASLTCHGYWQGEIWNRRKNGETYPQLLAISTVKDDEGVAKNYVGVMTDISQLKKSEANLEQLAHYDPLTGLPNRLLIHSRLEHAMTHAKRANGQVAVLFMDLDRFKNVNDSLGHPVGDHLLRALASRLNQRLRGDDTFGRLGGDEFLIILDHAQRPEDAAGIANELINLLRAPFELPNGSEVFIGASIGISIYPQDGDQASQLIQHADAAMYEAKEQGRDTFRFYTPALTEAVNQRMELESRMRRAIGNNEFVLHYQPQVDIESGRVIACEALLRWNDPDVGLIPPDEFIPLAEDTGLIVPLGEWLLRNVGAQFRNWIDRGFPPFCVSINLSARQLQQHDIVDRIADMLGEYALPAEQIKLELTESMIMRKGEEAVELLSAIKRLGVKLSIDDFGTGYSSLGYLRRFPIDELKIDRSFISDIPGNRDDAEIAATIIAMARNLRLEVIAEGVETEQQAAFLLGHGCHTYQGYLFRRPLPAEEFEQLMLGD